MKRKTHQQITRERLAHERKFNNSDINFTASHKRESKEYQEKMKEANKRHAEKLSTYMRAFEGNE